MNQVEKAISFLASRRPNPEFLVLLVLLCLFQLPFFSPVFIPVHDTGLTFGLFHFFYSNLLLNNEWTQWLPYGTYGMPVAFIQTSILSPLSYVAFAAGWLVGATDVLFLFKLSMLAEQAVFLMGVYLLAGALFTRRRTVFLVCLMCIGSTVWYAQIYLNFRICYLLPLMLYFIWRFFKDQSGAYFWLAGILAVFGSLQNTNYAVVVCLYILFLFFMALWVREPLALRYVFKRSLTNLSCFLIFTVSTAGFLYFLFLSMDHMVLLSFGRDAKTGVVDLDTFLAWGGNARWPDLFRGAILGWPLYLPVGLKLDNTVYMGLMAWPFFFIALIKEHSRAFFGLLIPMVALVWLSFGGRFAEMVYHLPFWSYFRHISLTYCVVRLLIIFLTGFGLDLFFKFTDKPSKTPFQVFLVFAVGFLATALGTFFFDPWDILGMAPFRPALFVLKFRIVMYAVLILVLILVLHRKRKTSTRDTGPKPLFREPVFLALTLALILDLGFYQDMVLWTATQVDLSEEARPIIYDVSRPGYQPIRQSMPVSGRARHCHTMLQDPDFQTAYAYSYNFSQFDPCLTEFRGDLIPKEICRLLEAGLIRLGGSSRPSLVDPFNRLRLAPSLQRILGCSAPKLRFVRRAVLAKNPREAEILMVNMKNLDETVILEDLDPRDLPPKSQTMNPVREDSILVTGFTPNRLNIEANLAGESGALLVYADSHHRGWKATVSGRWAVVAKAYLGLKAVFVTPGKNTVSFVFSPWPDRVLSYLVSVAGFLCGLVFLGALLFFTFSGKPRDDGKKALT